jgi:hypothetical protein
MSDNPEEFAITLATEIAKQFPVAEVYKDGFSSPVKETGKIATDFVKAFHLVFAPIQMMAALQDKYKNFLDKSVSRIETDQRIAPALQMLGPILESIKFEPENTPIDELFSNLLSCAMDRERLSEAHPSYIYLIKQISSDEAHLMLSLISGPRRRVGTQDFNRAENFFYNYKCEENKFPVEVLSFSENMDFYIDHLFQLGLTAIYQFKNQEPIFTVDVQTGVRIFEELRLTPLGKRFMKACHKEKSGTQ